MNISDITPNDIVLTGDRPTGRLHLGHYAGSLSNRLLLQDICAQTILVADLQALTDNAHNPGKVRENTLEVVLDYLAVGIDPTRTTVALQSGIPELAELFMLYLNLVSVARLERNPTTKSEIASRGFEKKSVPAGFLCYPVSQVADITAFCASIVPVGEDQLPILELASEIVSSLNRLAGYSALKNPRPLISKFPRLPGVVGLGKASKSAGNAISLSASADEIKAAVMGMYTDPQHLKVADHGNVEGNVVFSYLDAFDPDTEAVEVLKERYRGGGLGDMFLKRHLVDILEEKIRPIRERRTILAADLTHTRQILADGTANARQAAKLTLNQVRSVFGLH